MAVVYVLHQDFWNWKKADPLVFGFLPIGLAYHAGYSVLAAVMMAVLVKIRLAKAPRKTSESESRSPGP